MAAKNLHEPGYCITILESRNRLGGRIWTNFSHSFPIELGAEFIHGKPQEIFLLLNFYNLPTIKRSSESFYKTGKNFSSFTEKWNSIEELHQQIDPLQKISYADFLKKAKATPLQKKFGTSYVEGFHAADPELISAEAILATEQSLEESGHEDHFRLRDGYDSLIKLLASSLPATSFQLKNIVTKVE